MNTLQTTYKGDPEGMAAEMVARDDFTMSLGKKITDMAQNISKGQFHPEAMKGYASFEEYKLAFEANLGVYANALSGNNANRANVARTMRAMQIARKSTECIERILSDPCMFIVV